MTNAFYIEVWSSENLLPDRTLTRPDAAALERGHSAVTSGLGGKGTFTAIAFDMHQGGS